MTEDEPSGTIAETTLNGDGSFELVLPEVVPAELLTVLDAVEICPEAPEGLTLAPESIMGAGVFALGVGEEEAMTGVIAQASSEAVALEEEGSAQVGDYAVFHVYASEPVTVRGSCVREGETETTNLDLRRGWNTVVSTSTEVRDGVWSSMETTLGEVPTGAGWYFVTMPEMSEAEGETPKAVFTASGETFEGPESLSAGFVDITLKNAGERGYTLVLLRPKEDAAVEAVVSAIEAVDKAFAQGGDASAAMNQALKLSDIVGTAFTEPGATYSFGTTLEAGRYIAYGTADPAEEGVLSVSTHRTIEVAAGAPQAEAPQADVTVQMVDFAFALPPDISAGEQVWRVTNAGQQLHHLVLFKLQEGKTMDDFRAWMETEGEGEPAAEEAGGVDIMSAGQANYVDLELTPGEYVAICFMPDHAEGGDGAPHFTHGMMQSFTVAGK